MRVAVHASGNDAPQADAAQHHQQHAAEHLPGAFEHERQRPAERDQRAGTDREQQRMADGEPDGDAERARALGPPALPPLTPSDSAAIAIR